MSHDPDAEACWSCGYALAVHRTAKRGRWPEPDPDGGCPSSELEALRRWGLI